MKRNSVIFGVLCSLMVVTMVSSTLTEREEQPRLVAAESTDYKKVWTVGTPSVP